MSKTRRNTIEVQGTPIGTVAQPEGDYISLTDMLRAKDGEFFISDWLRNRNTVEFLGIWESVFNPNFNYGEFATIGQRPVSSMPARRTCSMSPSSVRQPSNGAMPSRRRRQHQRPRSAGAVGRPHHLESLNSVLIRQGLPQQERLTTLNSIAITQIKTLLAANNVKRLR